ncbi:MAG: hypothetical protein KDK71_01705, partial [Chlamydiia bacterium]|nr:hypothetical protein [Chlamydiia bacterium]
NLGTIKSWDGDVILIARHIQDAGAVSAQNGQVCFGAGESVLLKPCGEERIFIQPSPTKEKEGTGIDFSGTLTAVDAELKSDGNIYAFAIKDDGIIEATGSLERGGRVYLKGHGGKVEISGEIHAPKGKVVALAEELGLVNKGIIDVSGEGQGGEILFGGDKQGKNPEIQHAGAVFVGKETKLLANGIGSGDGGKIITWGDRANRTYGETSARGGDLSGDGGFIEISAKSNNYDWQGTGGVHAPHGNPGQFLLDPTDITLEPLPDLNVTPGSPNYTVNPTATARVDTTAAGPLITLLNGGSNVTISTNTAGPNAGTLTVQTAPVAWTGNGTLSLIANSILQVNVGIQPTGATAGVSLTSLSGDVNVTSGALVGGFSTGNITVSAAQDINFITGVALSGGGALNFTAGNDININGGFAFAFGGSGINHTFSAGNDIILTGSILSTQSIASDTLVIAGRNIVIQQSSQLEKQFSGDLTLVVDNNFPNAPNLGPGALILDASSSIVHSGTSPAPHVPEPLRIFTSRQSQNSILGTIRGLTFVPGTEFVDTNQERWCRYYPDTFYASPFTIFYKCDIPELAIFEFAHSDAAIVTVEALRNLHPYDEYLGWPLHFDFSYEKMERAPIPYFLRVDKHYDLNPKEKQVKTFNDAPMTL